MLFFYLLYAQSFGFNGGCFRLGCVNLAGPNPPPSDTATGQDVPGGGGTAEDGDGAAHDGDAHHPISWLQFAERAALASHPVCRRVLWSHDLGGTCHVEPSSRDVCRTWLLLLPLNGSVPENIHTPLAHNLN